MKLYLNRIPSMLTDMDRWGPWKPRVLADGRLDKYPVIATDKPELWGPFDQVNLKDGQGLGFCVTGLDGFVFGDIDACMEDGILADWGREILDQLPPTYTEVSPSGTGLRFIYQVSEKIADRQAKYPQHPSVGGKQPGYEVYGGSDKGRFLTMTGDVFDGMDTIELLDGLELMDFLELFPKLVGESFGKADGGDCAPDRPDELPEVDPAMITEAKDARAFWLGGDALDRSDAMFHIAKSLVEQFGKEAAYWLMAEHEGCMAAALEHRRDDEDRAEEYLWRNCVLAVVKKHGVVRLVDQFEDLGEVNVLREAIDRETQEMRAKVIPTIRFVSPSEAMERFIYLKAQDGVFDILHPRIPLKMNSFRNCFAGSKVKIDKALVPVTKLWLENLNRKTTNTVTFRPGYPIITLAPGGLGQGANTWVAPDRDGEPGDPALFLDHIDYLFKERAGDFLDWLAHIEQKPGELPHKGWLHISNKTGTGRNWLASVLARIWRGYVSPNQELGKLLGDQFNEAFGEALLVIIDEIREGGHDTWINSEKFKTMMNAEERTINRKFGLKSVEWNCARWLLFSNHLQALPLDDSDRRLEVVINEDDHKDATYYQALYKALGDPSFILGVAMFLRNRDITRFDPGARPEASEDRRRVIAASKSDLEAKLEDLIETWPCEVISSSRLALEVGKEFNRGMVATLHRLGCESLAARPRINDRMTRVWALRNTVRWRKADTDQLKEALATEGEMF